MAQRATASKENGTTKRRGRPPKVISTEPTQAVSVEDRFNKHFPAIKVAKAELDKLQAEQKRIVSAANSTYRNLLKAFKKEGGNTDMMIRVLNDQARELDEVERDARDYNAYARLAGLPIGTQLGLFSDGSSVASKVDEDRMASQGDEFEGADTSDVDAYHAGEKAGHAGKNPDTCPYSSAQQRLKTQWERGWSDAQAAMAHNLGKTPTHEPAHA